MCVCALGVVPLVGCGDQSVDESAYAQEDLWLCRPGIANDQCALADLSTTEIQADGTLVISDGPAVNPDALFDCFVVYETVDFSLEPGNAADSSPTDAAILEALYRNGARFRETCRMYAPLYRQMTLGTYYAGAWEETPHFQTAYEDIVEAFDYYMREHNQGRDMVLIGHSQGAHILARLMEDRFESDEALRGQLISALLIGAGVRVHVPEGELVGGNFKVIPLCSSASDTGCVIAFDSLALIAANASNVAAAKQLAPSDTRACVNPASFDDRQATLAAAMFSRSSVWWPQQLGEENLPSEVTTEWVSYPSVFDAQCDNSNLLRIGVANENAAPFTPLELQRDHEVQFFWAGLHFANFSLTSADLIRIVETQAATR